MLLIAAACAFFVTALAYLYGGVLAYDAMGVVDGFGDGIGPYRLSGVRDVTSGEILGSGEKDHLVSQCVDSSGAVYAPGHRFERSSRAVYGARVCGRADFSRSRVQTGRATDLSLLRD